MMESYGKELIIDLKCCDVSKFNRIDIEQYFVGLCELIAMVRCDLYFWDDVGVSIEEQQILSHTKGTSAVQFILTSNIMIHTLDELGQVFVNIFSCKDFDSVMASEFTRIFFDGVYMKRTPISINRGVL